MRQGQADPSLIFSREEVESLLLRKWRKLRKELVVDAKDNSQLSQEHDQHKQQLQHTRLRAVTKNPLFDYRASVAGRVSAAS